jgi:hypothetical protein
MIGTRLPRRLAAAAVAVALTAGGAGCSGGSGTHGGSSTAPISLSTVIASLPATAPSSPAALAAFLQQGFSRLGSARVTFTTALSGNALAGSGPVRVARGEITALDVHATVSGVGAVHYLLAGGVPYAALPRPTAPGRPYVVLGRTAGNGQLDRAAIGLQATKLLTSPATYRTLIRAASRVTLLGRTTVDGVPVLHYRAPVRVNDISAGDSSSTSVRFALSALDVPSLTVDLWVDGAGRPVRASAPAPDGRPSNVDFTLPNRPVAVSAPPSGEVDR